MPLPLLFFHSSWFIHPVAFGFGRELLLTILVYWGYLRKRGWQPSCFMDEDKAYNTLVYRCGQCFMADLFRVLWDKICMCGSCQTTINKRVKMFRGKAKGQFLCQMFDCCLCLLRNAGFHLPGFLMGIPFYVLDFVTSFLQYIYYDVVLN